MDITLYAVTDRSCLKGVDFYTALEDALRGGVTLLQLREKNLSDEEFICENCQKKVTTLNYTARDHCPYCLCSKHLDINPGDRENNRRIFRCPE